MNSQGPAATQIAAGTSNQLSPFAPNQPVVSVSTSAKLPPSYILEKRPVSYDAPFSF
jgi:hypothetical protein